MCITQSLSLLMIIKNQKASIILTKCVNKNHSDVYGYSKVNYIHYMIIFAQKDNPVGK